MPTFVDMVKFESEAPKNVIRLAKIGEFYRAYNHSAWLFQTFVTEYKVCRKFIKSLKENVFYIGFPEKNLIANIDGRKYDKTDYGFDITLRDDEQPDEEAFPLWKNSVSAEPESKADILASPLCGMELEHEVCRRLRDFPLESKSMVDCTVFVAELRKLIAEGAPYGNIF